jgi:hypothetical protein
MRFAPLAQGLFSLQQNLANVKLALDQLKNLPQTQTLERFRFDFHYRYL